jgi:serine/threonine protein kinase
MSFFTILRLLRKAFRFGHGEPVVHVKKDWSAFLCTSSFLQESSSEAMLPRLWFGYLLILSWVAISNATEGSNTSAFLSRHKPVGSSMLPMIATIRGRGHAHVPTTTRSPSALLTSAPAGSSLPLPMKTHSHVSRSLTTPSEQKRKLSAPASDVPPPPAPISAPGPVLTSTALDPRSPSLSPHIHGCCKSNMMLRPGSHNCSCVYPIRLQLRILNVSTSSTNWSAEFQQELASQLGLMVAQFDLTSFYIESTSELNMSMDIAPLTGMSFSYQEAGRINYTLVTRKLHLNSSLFGGYQLLNFTWVEPPALPPVPVPAPVISPEGPSPKPPFTGLTTAHGSGRKRPSLVLIIAIAIGIIVIVFVSMLIFWKCTSTQGKKPDKVPKGIAMSSLADTISNDGSVPHPSSTRFFAYEELKEATNNFELASVLGEGGFGRVFKGVLKDGTSVAIKKLSSGGHQGDREFLVEVEMLSRLHHRNLVKLLGYYSSRDSSQHLLCYELVPNGSLEAWLHGPLDANHPLDWETRIKIALDAARGLAYLHEDSQPCVIHRDFKASNILLENNFHAKVADFGLAKQAPEGRGNYLSTRVMGTFGYVAPEYAMTGHLLVKSDVYSYGVVLLELLSGRKPVDMSQPSGQENLVTWARPILRDKDRLEQLADPRLGGKYPKEDFVQVCAIAAACVAPEANQRPTMGEVVQSLKMVQQTSENHQNRERDGFTDTLTNSNRHPTPSRRNIGPSSTTFESDGSSSIFSSGPFSGLSGIDNDNLSRTAVFSEDLQEGR